MGHKKVEESYPCLQIVSMSNVGIPVHVYYTASTNSRAPRIPILL